jgi:phage-related protein (TIGR01555 family)
LLGALRQDGWRSTLGGLGSRADRGRPGSLEFIDQLPLTDYELTAAYRNLWLVRRLVEDPSNEALREGFGIEQDDIPEFMRLNYGGYHSEGAFERALRMAELKGGAGIYVGYSDVRGPDDLLQPAPEGEAEVTFLETFDRFQLQGEQPDTDTHSPTFDQSQVWCVSGQRRAGMRFHTSRMIKFKGAPLAGDLGLAQQDREWGDSSLQAVWTDVQRYGVFWQSVAHLLQVSSVGVVSLSGLIDMLASQNQDVARDRIELMNEAMSITRLFLLDASKGETYHREAVSFSDMPALLQEVQLATAGAFRRPVTKLFGRAPAGLNATGESDMRSWYDEVECYRERQVKPALRALLAITDGIEPDAIDFSPLWQPTEKECAETSKIVVDRYERLWSMKVASAAEIRTALNEDKPLEELLTGPPPEPEELPVDGAQPDFNQQGYEGAPGGADPEAPPADVEAPPEAT